MKSLKLYQNIYAFPPQRLRVIIGLYEGDTGYLVGWLDGSPHDKKDKRPRCWIALDKNGTVNLPMEILRPIPKDKGHYSTEGGAA